MKTPRCYKEYKDDRICDICSFSEKCESEREIIDAIEHACWKCKHKQYSDYTNMIRCTKFGHGKYFCSADLTCFPKLIRKLKLKKINGL